MSTAVTGAAVTAAAMRAAAAVIEQAGLAGLQVRCYRGHVCIQVSQHDGDAAVRADRVAALARLIGASPVQRDSRAAPAAFWEAAGHAAGAEVEVFTALAVRPAPGGAGSLAAGPDGQQAAISTARDLPPGWRWVTELDEPAAPAAARQEVA
jgi:hypothetical protein